MQYPEVTINSIIVKGEIQQREQHNEDCIKEYVEAIADGADFPPVDVYDDGENLFLADGFHRLEAYRQAGIDTVEVNIFEGTERDAILHAVGANANHGLRRTNADKRKAVMTLLTDNEWGTWSDTEIARRIVVTQPFVSKVRRELTQNGFECDTVRKGADGRLIETANIGARPQTEESEDSHGAEIEQSSGQESSQDSNSTDPGEVETADENDDESSPDSGSDDELGADDESSDQNEESNSGSEGNEADDADESTSADSDEEEPVPDSSHEEQATQEEDEEPEPDSNEPSSEETTEDAGDDNGSPESVADESQSSSVDLSQTDEVRALKSKIAELENTIAYKDQRIEELEAENAKLQKINNEFEEQLQASDDFGELAEELSNSAI